MKSNFYKLFKRLSLNLKVLGALSLGLMSMLPLQGQLNGLDINPMNDKKLQMESGSIMDYTLHVALGQFEADNNSFSGSAIIDAKTLANVESILSPVLFGTDGKIGIRIRASNLANALADLQKIGFEETGRHEQYQLLEGFLPVGGLASLDQFSADILSVRPMYKSRNNVGATTSQADQVLETNRLRLLMPEIDGRGMNIGVLSDSYDDLGGEAAGIASGDIPAAGVTIIEDLGGGGSDEGRAMVELIHDIAPGANQFFATAFTGQLGFANNIRALADAGCQVIVDDVAYFAEPFFQDGIIAQAVDEVALNNNVCYFSSAGNGAAESYESTNINFAPNPDFGGLLFYDFDPGPGVDFYQDYFVDGSFTISLQWDDPFFTVNGVDSDIDLLILGQNGVGVIAVSLDDNLATQEPVEITGVSGTGFVSIGIPLFAGPAPTRIKYQNFGTSHDPLEFDQPSSTVGNHASATEGVAVAAAPFFSQDPEAFTSAGPTTILFNVDGSRKEAPEVRPTPDITAPDATNTTFFGQQIPDGDVFPNFFGTSAAAPHAAAVAALMKQAYPGIDHKEVLAKMQATAIDISDPGFDNLTGAGLINAYEIFEIVHDATGGLTEDLEDGFLGSNWVTNAMENGRIYVTSDEDPCGGTNHLILDTWGLDFGGTSPSLNEAILRVDVRNTFSVNLKFDQKEFDEEDHEMSASFAGSENSDGVAYSFDGRVWTRLVSLTGSNSTNSCRTHEFDIVIPNRNPAALVNGGAAQARNTTGETQMFIKFQQFCDGSVPNDGLAFDNIAVSRVAGTDIPTMSQWGIMIFGLLIMNLSVAFIRRKEDILI